MDLGICVKIKVKGGNFALLVHGGDNFDQFDEKGFFGIGLGDLWGIRVKGSNFGLLVHGWREFWFNLV